MDIDLENDEDEEVAGTEAAAPRSVTELQGSVPAGVFGNVDPETLEKYTKKSKLR